MTIEEAKTFLDNLKVCVIEHPIVADWLVEIENRKTKPQNCEECPRYKFSDDRGYFCEDEPQTDCADTNLSGKPTDSTRSKMEQVETMSCQECKHWDCLINADWECVLKECKYEPKTEPQTERSE